MKVTSEDDQNWMANGRDVGVIADAREGDILELSRYVDEVLVMDRRFAAGGVALIVKSPRGSTRYRLRAVDDDDDRLLLEKSADDDGWTPHVRLEAEAK